jgi:hypothetical protein
MHAHKTRVTVPESGHVEIDLPANFRGLEAELIVRCERRLTQSPRGSWGRVHACLEQLDKMPLTNRTAEEVDVDIEAQRGSWGEDP